MTKPSNLYSVLPAHLPDELTNTLLEADDVRIERIVSHGHASPEGFWYDQDEPITVAPCLSMRKTILGGCQTTLSIRPSNFGPVIPPSSPTRSFQQAEKKRSSSSAPEIGPGTLSAQERRNSARGSSFTVHSFCVAPACCNRMGTDGVCSY